MKSYSVIPILLIFIILITDPIPEIRGQLALYTVTRNQWAHNGYNHPYDVVAHLPPCKKGYCTTTELY